MKTGGSSVRGDPHVTRTDFTTTEQLNQFHASWYQETLIENHTSTPVYVLRPDGSIDEVTPLLTQNYFGGTITVKQLTKVGRVVDRPMDLYGPKTIEDPKYPTCTIEINLKRLSLGPIYLPDVGLAIALQKDVPRLREENHLDPDFYSQKISALCGEYLQRGSPAPILILANCHNPSVDFMYVEIGGYITCARISHDLNLPESLSFLFRRRDQVIKIPINNIKWSDLELFEPVIAGQPWLMGTNYDKVIKRATELHKQRVLLKSPAEVELEVTSKTESLNEQVEYQKKQNEQLKRELETVRKDLTFAQAELSQINETSKATFEQQVLAAKLAIQANEHDMLRQKQQMQAEQQRIDLEKEKLKMETERLLAKIKERKNNYDLESSKVSIWSAIFKGLTVILPAIAAIVGWFFGKSSKDK